MELQELKEMYKKSKEIYVSQDKNISSTLKYLMWDKMQNIIVVYSMKQNITRFEAEKQLEEFSK